jgi:hypothetical protein
MVKKTIFMKKIVIGFGASRGNYQNGDAED